MSRFRVIGKFAAWTAIVATLSIAGARADEGPRVVTVAAKRFEFVPNQLMLKKGETVTLKVTSEDVKHGFFSRPLHVDADLTPSQTVEVPLTPAAAGTFTIICDHFCGAQHGNMKLTVVVE
jgi:cytochrome c oxidase subunit 2